MDAEQWKQHADKLETEGSEAKQQWSKQQDDLEEQLQGIKVGVEVNNVTPRGESAWASCIV